MEQPWAATSGEGSALQLAELEEPVRPPADPATVPSLTCSRWVTSPVKRAVDLVIGVLLVLLTVPLVVVLAIGSAISFRAWPFFTQQRLGRHGVPFRIVKMRSLPLPTPIDADKYSLDRFPTTRWGRAIRRTHLDEIPQLWLVVTGKMSLVGPRPEMPAVAGLFPRAFVRARCEVRPGCTGLWQVGPHASGLIGENPHYDLFYVTSGTAKIDARVLIRTVTQMMGASALTISGTETVGRDPSRSNAISS